MRRGSGLLSGLFCSVVVLLLITVSPARAEQNKGRAIVPAILRVQLDAPAKVKTGAKVRAHTVEPLYVSDQLAIPAGARVLGKVVKVKPVPHNQRVNAMTRGDFTPLHQARIQFNRLRLPSGLQVPISAAPAEQGSEVVHFLSAGASHPPIFRRLWAAVTGRKNQAVKTVTAPGKMHRLEKFVFWQLPWHPQWIEAGSQYDVTLNQMPEQVLAAVQPAPAGKKRELELKDAATLHARLAKELSSKTAKQDDPVVAVVTRPLYAANGHIEVPEGSVLEGRVLRARPAKKWGKNGALRFTFNRVDFPRGFQQKVSGVPSGVDGTKNGSLKLDSEGGVEPSAAPRIMAPLVLGLLATSALTDEDASLVRNGAASNGFGLITRIVAVSTGSRTMGGVVGMIAAGRSMYSHFIARGRDVTFPRNSEIEIEVGPVHLPGPAGSLSKLQRKVASPNRLPGNDTLSSPSSRGNTQRQNKKV